MRRLLAKSCPDPDAPGRGVALPAHTAEVLAAARALLDRRAGPSLDAVGLPAALAPRLCRLVILAAGLHDIGKCNIHFQEMVRGRRQPQLLRHEAVSGLLAREGALRSWLSGPVAERDLLLAIAAVNGHHRCYPDEALNPEAGEREILCPLDHPDVAGTLRALAAALALEPPPALEPVTLRRARRGGVEAQIVALSLEIQDVIASDREGAQLLPLVKALLIGADVAGSAFPRAGARADWVGEQLARRADADGLDRLVERRLEGQAPRPFQRAVADSKGGLALVRAGCGSGKTLAAWMWSRQHLPRQIWFCYPTTGTATEGYRDYLHDLELAALLEHGRAEVDLDILSLRDGSDELSRDQDRLAALRSWGAPVISCTVDTVLGLVRNQRKGLYAWPGLAHAAFVFDEIHAYDRRLFGALLRFLDALPGAPALLMTASLPAGRLSRLQALSRLGGEPLPVLEGPEALERLPRYQRASGGDPAQAARATLARGGKVLWVCNTVERCRRAAEQLAAQGVQALLYHSRYRYEDRVRRHQAVIEAFRAAGPAVACTTQVAEMSLDLSADLLVTELAPIPALIQRLGRLNRRSTPERPLPARPFLVLDPPQPLPYDDAQLAEATRWLDALGGGPLSQRDLVQAWSSADDAEEPPRDSDWLDGGHETRATHLRGGGVTVSVLLESDRATVERGVSPVALSLPVTVPRAHERALRAWPRVRGLPVVPDALLSYDPLRGADWRDPPDCPPVS